MPHILSVNGGSSSIRFAVYEEGEPLRRRLEGKVDRIGQSGTDLTFEYSAEKPLDTHAIDLAEHSSALAYRINIERSKQ